ncbi:MAG: FKBP-type peptidyl-prolyl cis-trans isomerase [Planctomycetota bacterium]|nr:FKBP-type peptidyl-prolyl cis-trans isomerase [Planctomycetota bacterium]
MKRRFARCANVLLLLVVMSVASGGCTLADGIGHWMLDPYDPQVRASQRYESSAETETDEMDIDSTPLVELVEMPVETDQEDGEVSVKVLSTNSIQERYEIPDGTRWPVLEERNYTNGLLIQDLRIGNGDTCTADSSIVVQYHGTLEDESTVVDSTRDTERRGPWPLAQLMLGWQYGLIGMQVGGVRRLIIPPDLAYGERAITDPETNEIVIPENTTLIYVIELIEIQ